VENCGPRAGVNLLSRVSSRILGSLDFFGFKLASTYAFETTYARALLFNHSMLYSSNKRSHLLRNLASIRGITLLRLGPFASIEIAVVTRNSYLTGFISSLS
jgi:hypothetical protein